MQRDLDAFGEASLSNCILTTRSATAGERDEQTYRENTDGVDRQLVQISVTHDGRFWRREISGRKGESSAGETHYEYDYEEREREREEAGRRGGEVYLLVGGGTGPMMSWWGNSTLLLLPWYILWDL